MARLEGDEGRQAETLLWAGAAVEAHAAERGRAVAAQPRSRSIGAALIILPDQERNREVARDSGGQPAKIGRASCRERV